MPTHPLVALATGLAKEELSAKFVLREIKRWPGSSPQEDQLVHFLYHYIADEDIRQSDVAYGKIQREHLESLTRAVDEKPGRLG